MNGEAPPKADCILTTGDHLYCHLTKELAPILKPLSHYLGIDYFDYQRHYHDGQTLILTPWTSYHQQYYAKNLYPTFMEFDRNKENIVFLSQTSQIPSCAENPQKFIDNVTEAHQNNIMHRIYFVYTRKNYFELFGFGSSNQTNYVPQFYWERMELLKKFQGFFYCEAQTIFEEGEKQKIVLPNFLSSTKTLSQVCANFSHEEFLNAISTKHYPIRTQQGVVRLTFRELQCLKLVYERHTSKEIAKYLNISPRTVEEYLLNIKNKFGCESKIDLINIAAGNPIINFFD